MKKTLLCMVFGICVFVFPASVPANDLIDKGSIMGAGAMTSESPYRGVDEDVYLVPVLMIESRQFFLDNTSFGYYFNPPSDHIRCAVLGSVRLQGYESDDSNDLSGMQDRDRALDAGFRIEWNNKIVPAAFEAVTDLSGTHEGQEIRLSFSKKFFRGFLTPKASIKWQSQDLVDYYYGVRPTEARAGRPEYKANDDLLFSAGVMIGVPLGPKWALFCDIGCSFLGDEAMDSPIVDDDTLMRYAAGAVFRF